MKRWLLAAALGLLGGCAALAARHRIEELESRENGFEHELNVLRNRETELEQRESELEQAVQLLTQRENELKIQVEKTEQELQDLRLQFEDESKRAQAAEARQLVDQQNYEMQLSEFRLQLPPRSSELPAAPELPQTVETFADLVAVAREHLEHVVVPPSAERDLHILDAAKDAGEWAQDAWLGLRALDEYARSAEDFQGGFWEWCEHGDARHRWPASQRKLAMRESRTVMESPDLRNKREFRISSEVKASGRVTMEAHLKIAEGGGESIPRIYFYDDAKGATGRIHIGFIGPHRLVPNTKTS